MPDTLLAVVDTNIVVSKAMNRLGAPARIIDAWAAGAFKLAASEPLLREYARALTYPNVQRRHGWSTAQIQNLLDRLRQHAVLVAPAHVPAVIAADPADDHVLACALAAGAGYIVSGDRHLLDLGAYQGIAIVTPARFVAVLDAPATG